MMLRVPKKLALGVVLVAMIVSQRGWAQDGSELLSAPSATVTSQAGNGNAANPSAGAWLQGCPSCGGAGCPACSPVCPVWCADHGFYAGSDFLFIRPHFSEAYAFVKLTQVSASPLVTEAEATNSHFGYEGSVRAFTGYRFDSGAELQFTFTHLHGDASSTGVPQAANEIFVDPLGNLATLGDMIHTNTSVETNVYDFDFTMPIALNNPHFGVKWSAGARIADVNEDYDALTLGPASSFVSSVRYSADFIGAGPRVGLEGRWLPRCDSCFSLFAKGAGSLLVGQLDVRAGATLPGFNGDQRASFTRTIPVAEIELGGSCRVLDCLTVSAGWLFQAWFDLGASGGNFGGFYVPTDDANIMSYDGLFLRAELTF